MQSTITVMHMHCSAKARLLIGIAVAGHLLLASKTVNIAVHVIQICLYRPNTLSAAHVADMYVRNTLPYTAATQSHVVVSLHWFVRYLIGLYALV